MGRPRPHPQAGLLRDSMRELPSLPTLDQPEGQGASRGLSYPHTPALQSSQGMPCPDLTRITFLLHLPSHLGSHPALVQAQCLLLFCPSPFWFIL